MNRQLLPLVLILVAIAVGAQYVTPRASTVATDSYCPPGPRHATAAVTATPTDTSYTTASGLSIQILAQGDGPTAVNGTTVSVHYTGTFTNGTKFDSSLDRKQPLEFHLGTGTVIKGFDEGIAGLRVGDKRRLILPYNLAYGEPGRPPMIPPKSTLIFEVQLMGVRK